MSEESIHEISVERVLEASTRLVRNYSLFVKHAPKLLRESMMLAYQTAVDDMLKAMDRARVGDAIIHPEKPAVVLLDENGHAS